MFVCGTCWHWHKAEREGQPPRHVHAQSMEGFIVTELYSDGTREYRTMWGHKLEAARMF